MARTYRTLSLSLPPEAVAKLEVVGGRTNKTAARVAAEAVLLSIAAPLDLPPDQGASMVLYDCIVHERDAHGLVIRQQQTISLIDITRIRGGRVDVLEIFLDGEWRQIEGKFDDFKARWERAKSAVVRGA